MTHLKEGDRAPVFTGLDQDLNKRSLSDYKGKKLVLFFYPKDNTPGCTAEACDLTQNYDKLTHAGFEVLGVSADDPKSHIKFISKFNLSFNLIADVEKKICSSYGVFGLKKFMGREYEGIHRTTFIISENQIIEKIFIKVKTKEHSKQILESYK